MSTAEHEVREQRSSVKISMNAKGEAIVEVKAYSNDLDALDLVREKAVAAYNATVGAVRGGTS